MKAHQVYVPFRVDESLIDTPAMFANCAEVLAARDVIIAEAKRRGAVTFVDLPEIRGAHSWLDRHDGVPYRGTVQYSLTGGDGDGWLGHLDVAWK